MLVSEPSHLILTVDYELFGNGSGCPLKCVVAPTERILSIAERFSAPVTLFVEALEYMAMEREPATCAQAEAVKEHVQSALKRGHDVQLHLHPQWVNASYSDEGRWVVDVRRWRLGDLEAGEIQRLLASSKAWLETLARAIRSDYVCNAFRAGAWCIQPSRAVLEALKVLGFRLDSTVAPGLRNAALGDWYDFRGTPPSPFWRVTQDVCVQSETGIWEVPIAVSRLSSIHHATVVVRKNLGATSGFAPGCSGSYAGPNSSWHSLVGRVSRFASLGRVMLDISTFSASSLIAAVKGWRSRFAHAHQPIPIVAIGHCKNFTARAAAELEEFLGWAITQEDLVLSTYDDWLKEVDKL